MHMIKLIVLIFEHLLMYHVLILFDKKKVSVFSPLSSWVIVFQYIFMYLFIF